MVPVTQHPDDLSGAKVLRLHPPTEISRARRFQLDTSKIIHSFTLPQERRVVEVVVVAVVAGAVADSTGTPTSRLPLQSSASLKTIPHISTVHTSLHRRNERNHSLKFGVPGALMLQLMEPPVQRIITSPRTEADRLISSQIFSRGRQHSTSSATFPQGERHTTYIRNWTPKTTCTNHEPTSPHTTSLQPTTTERQRNNVITFSSHSHAKHLYETPVSTKDSPSSHPT